MLSIQPPRKWLKSLLHAPSTPQDQDDLAQAITVPPPVLEPPRDDDTDMDFNLETLKCCLAMIFPHDPYSRILYHASIVNQVAENEIKARKYKDDCCEQMEIVL